MWLKNIFIYRLPGDCKITAATLQEKLAFKPLMPCSGLDKQSRGWVSLACGGRLGWGGGHGGLHYQGRHICHAR
ncbi:MAG: recombination-associated protein RdgC [Sideroxyarcus sp.]|nr:recombination-associated protein RdgC [Sideroxyarcus sp.]